MSSITYAGYDATLGAVYKDGDYSGPEFRYQATQIREGMKVLVRMPNYDSGKSDYYEVVIQKKYPLGTYRYNKRFKVFGEGTCGVQFVSTSQIIRILEK